MEEAEAPAVHTLKVFTPKSSKQYLKYRHHCQNTRRLPLMCVLGRLSVETPNQPAGLGRTKTHGVASM